MIARNAKWLAVALLVTGYTVMGAPRAARADLVLEGIITKFGDGTITVFASDNNLDTAQAPSGAVILTDTNLAPGIITLAPGPITGLPGYMVDSSTSFTFKSVGTNLLSTNTLAITNNTGAAVTTNIAVGDNDFLGPILGYNASASSTFVGASGSTYQVQYYADPSNTQPLFGQTPGVPPVIGGTKFADSGVLPVVGPAASPGYTSGFVPIAIPGNYANTERFIFTLVNGGTLVSRGQTDISAVPEPSVIVMAGVAGLFGLGYYRKNLRRRVAS